MVPPVTEVTVEETEQISSQLIGKVIGKGGESIRDLMARSGARMDVEQNVPPGLPRTLTYRGTRRSVDFAKMLVRMLTTEGVNESELPLGDATREILVIPAQSVGKIIGRAGDMVREIQSRSGARVQVEHSAPSSSAGMVPPDKKQVTITGLEPSVVKAKEMIMFLVSNPMVDALTSLNLLADDKLRGGGVWGSGPPYPNLPNQGYNMTPDMVAGGAAAYQQGMGAGAYGGAPFAGVGAYGGHQAYPGGAGAAYAAAPYAAPTGGGGAVEVDVTNVQRQYLGRIIGQRGVTINDLQRRSGCDIQVNQQQSMGSPDAEITIRGTRQGIEHVKHMIREIIEVGPAHPYAGGGDSARGGAHHGGGGGGGYGGYQQQQGYDYAQQAAYGAYQQPQMQQSYGQQQQSYGYQLPVAAQQPSYGQTATYSSGGQLNFGIPGPYGAGQQGGASYGTPAQPPVASLPPQQPPRSSSWKTATTPEGQGTDCTRLEYLVIDPWARSDSCVML
jgi:far upstream element-binding protein